MNTDLNTLIVDGYLHLLNSLSPDSKLELISKLSLSIKSDNPTAKANSNNRSVPLNLHKRQKN